MNDQERAFAQDTILVASGLALMICGAGMILAHPQIRNAALASLMPLLPDLQKSLSGGQLAGSVLPDVERDMKLRSM